MQVAKKCMDGRPDEPGGRMMDQYINGSDSVIGSMDD